MVNYLFYNNFFIQNRKVIKNNLCKRPVLMYRPTCKDQKIEAACVYPDVCHNLNTDHAALKELYREARTLPGIKKILIGSGVRYDLAIKDPEYVKELVTHHVGGYLKIAPEHTEAA